MNPNRCPVIRESHDDDVSEWWCWLWLLRRLEVGTIEDDKFSQQNAYQLLCGNFDFNFDYRNGQLNDFQVLAIVLICVAVWFDWEIDSCIHKSNVNASSVSVNNTMAIKQYLLK